MTDVIITTDNGNRDIFLAIVMLLMAIAAFTLLNSTFAVGALLWYRLLFVGGIVPFGLLILHNRPRPYTLSWLGVLLITILSL